jgi:hypothetical protein
MKIDFFTQNVDGPSSILNFNRLSQYLNVRPVSCFEEIQSENIVMMGYDISSLNQLRKAKPQAKILVCDVRQEKFERLSCADGIIVNGIEMGHYYAGLGKPIILSHIVPVFDASKLENPMRRFNSTKVNFCYHGNVIHVKSLLKFFSNYRDELSKLNCNFNLIFNEDEGQHLIRKIKNFEFVKFIPWTSEIYSDLDLISDFGIANSEIPIKNNKFTKWISSTILKAYNENSKDYFIRFKPTANPGRALSFLKMGIPCLVDFTPSNLQAVKHGINGYTFHGEQSLFEMIKLCCQMKAHEYSLMSANTLRYYQNYFDDEKEINNILSFFEGDAKCLF